MRGINYKLGIFITIQSSSHVLRNLDSLDRNNRMFISRNLKLLCVVPPNGKLNDSIGIVSQLDLPDMFHLATLEVPFLTRSAIMHDPHNVDGAWRRYGHQIFNISKMVTLSLNTFVVRLFYDHRIQIKSYCVLIFYRRIFQICQFYLPIRKCIHLPLLQKGIELIHGILEHGRLNGSPVRVNQLEVQEVAFATGVVPGFYGILFRDAGTDCPVAGVHNQGQDGSVPGVSFRCHFLRRSQIILVFRSIGDLGVTIFNFHFYFLLE